MKGFHSCGTNGGFLLSLGKEGDKDSLLLERSLFHISIKTPASDDIRHFPGLGSCRGPQVSQEGAEAPVPSVPACVDSSVQLCCRLGASWHHWDMQGREESLLHFIHLG